MTNLSDYFDTSPKEHIYSITNPGAETNDMTGWTVETGSGFETSNVNPAPNSGNYFFTGGNNAVTRSYQDITAIAGDLTAADIDTEKLLIKLTWEFSSFDGSDESRVYLTFRDSVPADITTNQPLLELDAGSATWQNRESFYIVPANTRFIRIHMHGDRASGSFNNSNIDEIALIGYLLR